MLYYRSLNLSSISDQLIIVEEIKMNLLAKSCFAPGLISMISNMIASIETQEMDEFGEEWLKEYSQGMGHEIYRKQITENDFQNHMTFGQIASIAHSCFDAIVFAMEIEAKNYPNARSVIRLNPTDFVFTNWKHFNFYIYIICEDDENANQVQKLDMSDEKYLRLIG